MRHWPLGLVCATACINNDNSNNTIRDLSVVETCTCENKIKYYCCHSLNCFATNNTSAFETPGRYRIVLDAYHRSQFVISSSILVFQVSRIQAECNVERGNRLPGTAAVGTDSHAKRPRQRAAHHPNDSKQQRQRQQQLKNNSNNTAVAAAAVVMRFLSHINSHNNKVRGHRTGQAPVTLECVEGYPRGKNKNKPNVVPVQQQGVPH